MHCVAVQGGALLTHSLKWPGPYFIDGKTELQEVSHLPERSQPWVLELGCTSGSPRFPLCAEVTSVLSST